jgi:hypothetical protein
VKRYKQVHAPLFILQICTIFPSYSPATGFHVAAHVFPFSLHSHERYLLLVATLPLTNYHYLTRPDCLLGEQKVVLRSCCVTIGTGSSFRFCESTDRKDAQCPCSARRCPLLQISRGHLFASAPVSSSQLVPPQYFVRDIGGPCHGIFAPVK